MPRVARRLTQLTTIALGALALGCTAALAAPNPAANIPLGPLPAECESSPSASGCEHAVVLELDRARAVMGLGRYLLPSGFTALTPDRQLLVLSDLDRLAYSLAPVPGLNGQLDASAGEGVLTDSDPLPPVELTPGGAILGYASNWAHGYANALEAYYVWMYDDGYASTNIDCTTPEAPGCWGHRQNVLATFTGEGSLSMGAAAGADAAGQPSDAMLIALSAQLPAYSYTWSEALAEGAGAESGEPEADAEAERAAASRGEPAIRSSSLQAPSGTSATCTSACPTPDAATGTSTSSAPTSVSARVATQLVSHARLAHLAALLTRGDFRLRLRFPEAGLARVRWYRPRRPGTARAALLATGSLRVSRSGSATVDIRLTTLGRRLLRHRLALRLSALASFTPVGASVGANAGRSFLLRG